MPCFDSIVNPWPDIEREIARATATPFSIEKRTTVGGGCINAACSVEGGGRRYFVKLNEPHRLSMFEAEAAALEALASAGAVKVPQPVCHGCNGDASWIVLEHVSLRARDAACDATLGTRLASLHRHMSEHYGWHHDNTLGSTSQPNSPSRDWIAFWAEHRLGFQLRLARTNGHAGHLQRIGERLLECLPVFFRDYTPFASLLHGDLWSGNAACNEKGEPVVFDPAVYYGDREADIAMTELFGGYSRRFYDAYQEAYALDAGYGVRKTLYNLYHVLNHLNLFGGGYRTQAESMIDSLLAQV